MAGWTGAKVTTRSGKVFWLRALLPQRNGVRADDLKSLVRRCDVVFCPTDINGHNACKIVKRLVNLKGLWWRFCSIRKRY